MDSFRALIADIGTANLARLLDVDESHVRVMKTRNSIPAEYWGLLLKERPSLSYETLRKWRGQRFAAEVAA